MTISGTGGVGKTRLGLHVAAEVIAEYSDGVWLVELAPVSDTVLVPRAVAAVLGIREKPAHLLIDTLGEVLRDRQLLLILDNCEHLIQACAELAYTLLRHCPELKVLATSREKLGVPGEITWQLPPLAVSPQADAERSAEPPHSEAERLFIERAHAAQPGFRVTEHNAER